METAFRHPALSLRDTQSDKGLGVFATQSINPHTLLILERSYSAPNKLIYMNGANKDVPLIAKLHPRQPFSLTDDAQDHINFVMKKLSNNVIQGPPGTAILARNFNFINHGCNPNAVWANFDVADDVIYVCVHTTRMIKEGEEITIQYGPLIGHEEWQNKFVCHCGISKKKREDEFESKREYWMKYLFANVFDRAWAHYQSSKGRKPLNFIRMDDYARIWNKTLEKEGFLDDYTVYDVEGFEKL